MQSHAGLQRLAYGIRVDGTHGFASLVSYQSQSHHIYLDVGNPKNANKNPSAEKAIQEIGLELLHIILEKSPVNEVLTWLLPT